jgi:hypothetical protein
MLESEMAMEINFCGHHGFARQINSRRSRRNPERAAPPYLREMIALDYERRILDDATVAGNQPRPFKYRPAVLAKKRSGEPAPQP